jgi:hypothetical protein
LKEKSSMALKSKTRAYYELDSRSTTNGPGWEIANRKTLQRDKTGLVPKVGWPDGPFVLPRGPWTLPEYLEPPHFVFDRKLGHDPRDIESIDGFFFISPKMKAVFEELAPGGATSGRAQRNIETATRVRNCGSAALFGLSAMLSIRMSRLSASRPGGVTCSRMCPWT